MANASLKKLGSALASASYQVGVLEGAPVPAFQETLRQHGLTLHAGEIEILQVNVGKLCNQTCAHCHVDAGPDRKEIMDRQTLELCLDALDRSPIEIVDITGGAPELNPHFRWFVGQVRERGRHVIDRCNLTVLTLQGQSDLAEFLAAHRAEVVSSLPCYQPSRVDQQRGQGVFDRSIQALQRLNRLGYGRQGSGLVLNLVYNPVGAYLPPCQSQLEDDYRRNLHEQFGISFNHLYAITNMPISRFLDFLIQAGKYEEYMERLVNAFNPAAVAGLMCRNTISIGWDGRLYDCDFNQMLELEVHAGFPAHVRDFDYRRLAHRPIVTGRHCYGCSAGAGSSCAGAVVGVVAEP